MTPARIAEIRARCEAATPGPLQLGTYGDNDPVEKFAENISHGSGPVWIVWAPEHPLTVLGDDPLRPVHAVTMCLTGNGPTSEANAAFIAHAPTDLRYLLDELERVTRERDEARLEVLAMRNEAGALPGWRWSRSPHVFTRWFGVYLAEVTPSFWNVTAGGRIQCSGECTGLRDGMRCVEAAIERGEHAKEGG